ncbi:hypothetical protein ES708_33046 [subsurface metagenome]
MGQYALKYPKVDPEVLKHEIIPEAADECARQRAEKLWTAKEYRQCLSRTIKQKIRERAGR